MRRKLFALFLLVALVATACGPKATPTPAPVVTEAPKTAEPTKAPEPTQAPAQSDEAISVAGSTTVQPLAEKLAEAFNATYPNVKIDVAGGGSSAGVKAAGDSTADIGMASREIKQSEIDAYPQMQIFVIARDGIAIVAHPQVPVDDLTIEQVRGIFAGDITNWSEVGGDNQPIAVISREEGSGTRGAFEEMVMGEEKITDKAIFQDSNGTVRTAVASTPDSIAYLSFGYLDNTVSPIDVNGVTPTEANASSGTYPIVRPLNLVTPGEPTGIVKTWLDWILGPEGQEIVKAQGYIPVQ